jgi:hypothetical protein
MPEAYRVHERKARAVVELPDDLLRARIRDLEVALELMGETFVVHELEKAWRWDVEDGQPELIEPFANAAINARLVLDRDGWFAREVRHRTQ